MAELKPCPFCGTTPILHKSVFSQRFDAFAIYCPNTNCGVKPSTPYRAKTAVINGWNRRANDD